MRSKTKPKTASALVTNSPAAPAMTSGLQVFTFNAKTTLVRNDTMEGRDYKVVPMVMMTVGVHNGSGGSLYYPKEELAKTPEVWNCKPVVVYHPTINGKGVSACDPIILTTHKIGVIMNTKCDKLGRLCAEAWIEEARANAVDVRIMEAVNKGEMMEVSTGVFTDNVETPGEWEGEAYTAIATNHRPDHLAILPDKKGACSIEDGAGLMRNEAAKQLPKATQEMLHAGAMALVRSISIVGNELSLDNVRSQLWGLVREKLYPNKTTLGNVAPDVWIEDVYATFFVYSFGGKLFKLGYANNGTKVELEGEPSEVVRVTEYRTAQGAFVGNQNTKPVITMNKTEIINGLIANTASGWKETDREFLTGLPDEKLTVIANAAKAPAAPAPVAPAPVAPVAPVAPALNAQDQEALNYGKQQLAANKAKLVAVIVGNKANKFTEAVLNSKGIEELENLAALAAVAPSADTSAPAPRFFGQAPVAPVGNAADDDMLAAPAMSFDK